jgi:hypothetical protein
LLGRLFKRYQAIVNTHARVFVIAFTTFKHKMTFAIEWAEDYQVPSDITSGIDICEMPGASAFVASVGAVGSLIIQEFILNGVKKSIIGGKYIHSIAY